MLQDNEHYEERSREGFLGLLQPWMQGSHRGVNESFYFYKFTTLCPWGVGSNPFCSLSERLHGLMFELFQQDFDGALEVGSAAWF